VVPGADGVIGTDVFQEFLLRLDARARVLELTPFADGIGATGRPGDPWIFYERPSGTEGARGQASPAYHLKHVILLPTTIDGQQQGYFLLDTGSAFSAISDQIASRFSGPSVALFGAQGQVRGRRQPVRLEVGGEPLVDPEAVAVDLSAMSAQQGVEISGTIGYSLLRRRVLTINYRDGLVQLAHTR
jgi:hypothetical protein